jgi:2-oxoglutarate dehydrogenase E1 component
MCPEKARSLITQGVVFETMGLSDLHDYTTGGTVHIVVNNQIGFTTDPRSSRSSPYCTDVAKAIQAPVFHVNGDDVEAVARMCRLAAQWRQTFKRDVVIDIVCYRKHGHNEIDNAFFTQPQMYTAIKKQKPVLATYTEQLIREGVINAEKAANLSDEVMAELREKLEASRSYQGKKSEWLSSNWKGLLPPNVAATDMHTGVPKEALRKMGQSLTTLPADLKPHKKVTDIYTQRAKMVEDGNGIDWALAEQLAWASLLVEGNHVRISGQDVERGTFSHRHAVVHDQVDWPRKYSPLTQIDPTQAAFTAVNSSLSEFAVLGFELGYALENPRSLIMWEAQFGDFANTAQCMIDQFVCSGEQKWLRQSGLVMLLPHSYEGQGPEHSSARLERFLQLCDDDEDVFPEKIGRQMQVQAANWQVVNVTTPANYFHVLRRQVVREFRKPLVVMSPKSLLRHRLVRSHISEFDEGTRFMRYLPDTDEGLVTNEKVRKLVLCSGKVYYDLIAERSRRAIDDIAIGRLEQISPFPHDYLQEEAKKYPNAKIVWCQEESKNAGAWSYVNPRIRTAMRAARKVNPSYAGRKPAAATATGSPAVHAVEQAELLDKALA